MHERKDVRKGEHAWGKRNCAFVPNPSTECLEAATQHFIWLETLEITQACDDHAQWLRDHSIMEMDEHEFGTDCGMPGSLWHFSEEDEEGWCFFPVPDDISLLVEEPELVGAGVR